MDLLLASIALLVAHFVRGVTGFGQSLVAIPALMLIWGPQEAIFVVTAGNLLSGFVLLRGAWSEMRLLLIAAILGPLILGQHLGTELLVSLEPEVVRRTLGGVVLLFGLDVLIRPVKVGQGELADLPPKPLVPLAVSALAGLIGGVMGGLVGTEGPPIVITLRRMFTNNFIRAQLIAVFQVGAVTLTVFLWMKGAGDGDSLLKVVALLPAMAVGALVGERLSGKISPVRFGRLVGLLLTGSGLTLLLK